MRAMAPLTPDDTAVLGPILDRLSQRSGFPHTLDSLLRTWAAFAVAVRRGYDKSIYEYTNDLSVRDLLSEITDAASPALRDKIAREIEPWDVMFRETTEDVERPLLPCMTGGPPGWWWYRIPKHVAGALHRDLFAKGRPTP